jgi:hypothetical protein
MLRNSLRPVGLTTESLELLSRLADRPELSADPRQRDLARLLSAIVPDGPTGRKLFGDDVTMTTIPVGTKSRFEKEDDLGVRPPRRRLIYP